MTLAIRAAEAPAEPPACQAVSPAMRLLLKQHQTKRKRGGIPPAASSIDFIAKALRPNYSAGDKELEVYLSADLENARVEG